MKSGAAWRRGAGRGLEELRRAFPKARCFGVYLGDRVLRDGSVDVLPLPELLDRLSRGRVIG